MSNQNSSSSSGGIGLFSVLGLIFIVLKLTGVINWSWVWVLAPFWIGIALLILFVVVVAIVVGINEAFNRKR